VEFYEHDELAGQLDNWSGPTVNAVLAMIRAAGFARAEVLKVIDHSATIAASRKWKDLPPEIREPITLLLVHSHHDRGRTFMSSKEAYLTVWCSWPELDLPDLDTIFPEVDGFGVAPLQCAIAPSGLVVHVRVPPGLQPGRHELRLKIGTHGWSGNECFFVDLPSIENELRIAAVQDSRTWTREAVDWAGGGWSTVWIDGLSPEADCGNTRVIVGGVPHTPDAVIPGGCQVNFRLRPIIGSGRYELFLEHRGARSNVVILRVVGDTPAIPGLEKLRADH
jgi:hypothetical protein